MPDREKVIRIIDELIFEAQKEQTWKAENALRCLKKELLKEQETANLYKCPNCGTWISAENVVRCKHCKWYDERISLCNNCGLPREQTFFCADGKRRIDDLS